MNSPIGLLVGLSILAGVALGPVALLFCPGVVLAFSLFARAPSLRERLSRSGAIVVCIAALIGVWRGAGVSTPQTDPGLLDAAFGTATVLSMPQPGTSSDRVSLRFDSVSTRDGLVRAVDAEVLAYLPISAGVNVGDRLNVSFDFDPLEQLSPGYARFVRGEGAQGTMLVHSVTIETSGTSWLRLLVDVRRETSNRLHRLIPGDAGVLASGIVTGDDAGFSEDTAWAFRVAGVSHITAVSGQNIAMLAGLWAFVIRGGRYRRALALQIALITVVLLYVVMVGANPPSLRAALFVVVGMFAARFGRRPDYLTILALVSAALVLQRPATVQSVSFWLSFVASAALVTAFDVSSGSGWQHALKRLSLPLVAAQLATIPISIAVFGTWSFGSIIANLIVAPIIIVAFPMTFALAALAFIGLPMANVIAWLPELLLTLIVRIVTSIATTFGQIDLHAAGLVAIAAVTIPCIIGIGFISDDARRWWKRLREAYRNQPIFVFAGIAGTCTGLLVVFLGFALR